MNKDRLKNISEKPGAYLMKDAHGNVIYVGKAKNLKARLRSYFTGSHDHKTTKLLNAVDSFETIVTKSELEALILEIDLIKRHRPRYNVLLTDDKSYPYITVTSERHPKLMVVRPMGKTAKNVFGPYPNVRAARETIHLLHKLYPLRKCHKLPKEACLYYHLGQCLAPCVNAIDKATYNSITADISRFLKGDTKSVLADLEKNMNESAEHLLFEQAAQYKSTIESIKTTTEKQSVNLDDFKDRDIIAFAPGADDTAIEMFFVRNGKLSARDTRVVPRYLDAGQSVIDYLAQFYDAYPVPAEILTNDAKMLAPLSALFPTTVKTPLRGPKKDILKLAVINAEEAMKRHEETEHRETEKTFAALDALSDLLNIPPPYHIEAFDNSHLHGTDRVGAMVVFKNARPSKRDYRKYRLSDTNKGDVDDMEEVLYRRYRRLLLDKEKRPDIILVDGGIHQLNTALKTLASLDIDIPVAGIVKSPNHKTDRLIASDMSELDISADKNVYALLSRIQEEVHRFAVDYHKTLRQKGVYATVLDTIEGVGDKTKKKLLERFKTLENMRRADLESLKKLKIPDKTARRIMNALNEGQKR